MFSVDEAVDYLVQINFGMTAFTIPLQTSFNNNKSSDPHKELYRLNAYKNELRSMPVEDLEKLFLETRKQTKLD